MRAEPRLAALVAPLVFVVILNNNASAVVLIAPVFLRENDPESVLLVKGSVPGPNGGLVTINKSDR